MSKAITIQQKGVAQNITVDKLQVHKAGGTAYWVPEDTVELHALIATANGEYSAVSAGKYGYGYASVSVPGSSVTGTGSDGNQHVITTDGSGAIVDTKVPSEIRIITPPDYVGPYGDGAYISFDGLTVEAFYADGTSAGVIDPQDLSFPVTVARYDPEAGMFEEWAESDLDLGVISQPIPMSVQGVIHVLPHPPNPTIDWYFKSGTGKITGYKKSATSGYLICASKESGAVIASDYEFDDHIQYDVQERELTETYAHNNKTVYWDHVGHTGAESEVEPNCYPGGYITLSENDYGMIAWTLVYGDIVGTSGGVQIPVQYSRPGDGLVLEDSFGISVVPGPSGGDD